MAHSFQNIPAKPCFGDNREPLEAGDYIQKKKARATYCNSNVCIKKNTGTYENYNLLHKAQQLDKCSLPFNKYNLNRNLFTELNTDGLCVLRDASNNACATTINPSLNIYDSYIIDPSGVLFGNSVCGINNFVNLMTKIQEPISYNVTGNYDISSNSNYNTIIIFKSNGTFTLNNGRLNIDTVTVGGGGGGGQGTLGSGPGGGGGGGGGVIENSILFDAGSYIITVGAGGPGVSNLVDPPGQPGTNGGNSYITGNSTSIVANGGYGGQANFNGGASGTSGSTGGTYNPGLDGSDGFLGGGGAGAGFVHNGGNGSVNITTTNYGTTYGAGGGGGGGNGGGVPGNPGNSNAGKGGPSGAPLTPGGGNGVDNTGGGGGGGASGTNNSYIGSGNGGSGVVILSFNI